MRYLVLLACLPAFAQSPAHDKCAALRLMEKQFGVKMPDQWKAVCPAPQPAPARPPDPIMPMPVKQSVRPQMLGQGDEWLDAEKHIVRPMYLYSDVAFEEKVRSKTVSVDDIKALWSTSKPASYRVAFEQAPEAVVVAERAQYPYRGPAAFAYGLFYKKGGAAYYFLLGEQPGNNPCERLLAHFAEGPNEEQALREAVTLAAEYMRMNGVLTLFGNYRCVDK